MCRPLGMLKTDNLLSEYPFIGNKLSGYQYGVVSGYMSSLKGHGSQIKSLIRNEAGRGG